MLYGRIVGEPSKKVDRILYVGSRPVGQKQETTNGSEISQNVLSSQSSSPSGEQMPRSILGVGTELGSGETKPLEDLSSVWSLMQTKTVTASFYLETSSV